MEVEKLASYIIFFIGAIIISLVANKLVLKFARTLGIRNKNDVLVRWSTTSKPSLGGISLYFTFIVGVFFYAAIYSENNIFGNLEFIGLISASTLGFFIGMMDDAYDTNPMLKLLGQISCGLIFVFTANGIDIFHQPFIDGVITVLWVVAVMNSLNMLDNMDGITSTVSFFILATCLVLFTTFSGFAGSLWPVFILIELGALVGFLYYNIHPSRMFMGDTGSQFLAVFVAFFGVKAIWNLPAAYETPSWTSIFLILAAFTPAVSDTLTVMINRTKRGVSVMQGGKDHTTHHLVYKGYTDFGVWLTFAGISLASFLVAIALSYLVANGQIFLSLVGGTFFLIVFIPLYRNTLRHPAPIKKPEKIEKVEEIKEDKVLENME